MLKVALGQVYINTSTFIQSTVHEAFTRVSINVQVILANLISRDLITANDLIARLYVNNGK